MYDRIKIVVTEKSNPDILAMFIDSFNRLNLKNPPTVRQG